MFSLPITNSDAFVPPQTVQIRLSPFDLKMFALAKETVATGSITEVAFAPTHHPVYDAPGFTQHTIRLRNSGHCVLRSESESSGEGVETDILLLLEKP